MRLCFVLGNLTAKNEQARLRLFQEKEGMDTLLTVLKTYDEFDAQVSSSFGWRWWVFFPTVLMM